MLGRLWFGGGRTAATAVLTAASFSAPVLADTDRTAARLSSAVASKGMWLLMVQMIRYWGFPSSPLAQISRPRYSG